MPLLVTVFSSVAEKIGNYHQSSFKANPKHVHMPEDCQSCMSNLQRSLRALWLEKISKHHNRLVATW